MKPKLLAGSLGLVLILVAPGSDALGQTRPERLGAGEHSAAGRDVAKQKEGDWADNRWSQTDVGQFLASNLEVSGAKIAKALTVKVGANNEGSVCYDTAACALRAGWLGGFVRFDPARFGLINAPRLSGEIVFSLPTGPGWPGESIRYRGLHPRGHRVVLEYAVDDMTVLDSPWLESTNGLEVFTRSLELGPNARDTRLALAQIKNGQAEITYGPDSARAVVTNGPVRFIVEVAGADATLTQENGVLFARIPKHDAGQGLKLMYWKGPADFRPAFDAFARAHGVADGLGTLVAKPGEARWLPELKTTGQRGLDTDILAIDTLTVPYENPWNALFFLAGVDFTSDGTAFVCGIHGDAWRVTGIDDQLGDLRWKRFATGLFQPLGLKVRDGSVFVLGRDQITRLHDRNSDGEADFYENFCNRIDTSTGGHDYVTSLEKDDAGNFYYVDPRGAHRVSADGQRDEILATGFRNANGLGASPDGTIITVAPQQGEWTPSSFIAEAKPGGYFGYGGPKTSAKRPLGYDAPLCWIPHSVDNSSGSQVWVPRDQWGPLGGQMLHLLWGRCGLMLTLRDVVDGVAQGAVVPLPGRFLSGPNRGTFNSKDGHLYVAGSTGWQTSAAKDGALQRVRFTGKPVFLPIAWHAHSNGLSLKFSQSLDPATAQDTGSYAISQWNYRYAAQYGSKDWSVTNPDKEGHDDVAIKSARLLPDGKSVFLEIPNLRPVMQMEIKYNLNSADGKAQRSQLWLTLNELAARHSLPEK